MFFPVADEISVHAKLGIYFWDTDLVIESGSTQIRQSLDDEDDYDDDGTAAYLGMGAMYHLTEQISVGVEYLSYVYEDAHIGTFSGVVSLHF